MFDIREHGGKFGGSADFKPNQGYDDMILPIEQGVTLKKKDSCLIINGKVKKSNPEVITSETLSTPQVSGSGVYNIFKYNDQYSFYIDNANRKMYLVKTEGNMEMFLMTTWLGANVSQIINMYVLSNGNIIIFYSNTQVTMHIVNLDINNRTLNLLSTTHRTIYTSHIYVTEQLSENVFVYATAFPGSYGTTDIFGVFVDVENNTITTQKAGNSLSNPTGNILIAKVSNTIIGVHIRLGSSNYYLQHTFANIENDNCWTTNSLSTVGGNLSSLRIAFNTPNYYYLVYAQYTTSTLTALAFNKSTILTLTSGGTIPTDIYSVNTLLDKAKFDSETTEYGNIVVLLGNAENKPLIISRVNRGRANILTTLDDTNGTITPYNSYIDRLIYNNYFPHTLKGFANDGKGLMAIQADNITNIGLVKFILKNTYDGYVLSLPTETTAKVRIYK